MHCGRPVHAGGPASGAGTGGIQASGGRPANPEIILVTFLAMNLGAAQAREAGDHTKAISTVFGPIPSISP